MLMIRDIIIAEYLALYLSIFLKANLLSMCFPSKFSRCIFLVFFIRTFSLFCFIKLIACNLDTFFIGNIDDTYTVIIIINIDIPIVLIGMATFISSFASRKLNIVLYEVVSSGNMLFINVINKQSSPIPIRIPNGIVTIKMISNSILILLFICLVVVPTDFRIPKYLFLSITLIFITEYINIIELTTMIPTKTPSKA